MKEYNRVFFDTSPVIYLLQHIEPYYDQVMHIMLSLQEQDSEIVLSDFTIAEYCVHPYREQRQDLIDLLHAFIEQEEIMTIHSSVSIAQEAARIRADYPAFKMMDALQLASAISCGCDLFLTNDKQLRQFDRLPCVTTSDI